jgi:hypothetical protein
MGSTKGYKLFPKMPKFVDQCHVPGSADMSPIDYMLYVARDPRADRRRRDRMIMAVAPYVSEKVVSDLMVSRREPMPALRGPERQRRYYARRRSGRCVLPVEVDHDRVILALLESSRLSEEEALRRELVTRAVAEIVEEWAARWLRDSLRVRTSSRGSG